MSTQLKLRRGTTVEHGTFTGAEGEVTVDTTKDTLVVHDNVTVGGHPMAKESTVATQLATKVGKDSDTGAAFIPSGTTAQRPSSPSNGYLRYNTTLGTAEIYSNGSWGSVGGGATGGGADKVFVENEYTITSNYTIPVGKSAVTVADENGDIHISDGVDIILNNGSRWVVL